jgi:hypothetical protein
VQSLAPRAGDRPGLLLAQLIQLAAPLPQPATPTLLAIDQPLTVKIQRDEGLTVRSILIVILRFTLASELALGLPQRRGPPLARAQLLGQLVATRLPVEPALRSISSTEAKAVHTT